MIMWTTSEDGGGVHINSGIPNHAFYVDGHGARRICLGKGWSNLVCNVNAIKFPEIQISRILRT